jgi:hypothetical protein
MKKLYASLNPLMVSHIKNILENDGVACITRNEHLASIAGGIPLSEC